MFSFFLPKAVKQGRQFAEDARKMEAYKRDLWDDETRRVFAEGIGALEAANKTRDAKQIEEAARHLDQLCHQHLPKVEDAGWRENVEVFLVAIVIALAVRTYFLQPFTIPTGSMQPTLNGVRAFQTEEPPPNSLVQIAHTAFFGRTWIDTVAKDDEVVFDVREISRYFFFTYTQVMTSRLVTNPDGSQTPGAGGNTYVIHAPANTIAGTSSVFHVDSMRTFKKGDPIARGYINTGDHVFVDKLTYHFRKPHRGDVFVFNTQNIPLMGEAIMGPPPKKPSQFYIKRLGGLPNDEMRIEAPELFINGRRAEEPGFVRVMSAKDGYRGYANSLGQAVYLRSPEHTFLVPDNQYFALGDNSYQSSDSRFWGGVPQGNLMGRGVFVYWPFTSHWGLIR